MSYTDPNDPMERRIDPVPVETRSDSGVTWFIVGALVIAAGVLAYLYFGENNTTAQNTSPTSTEAPADTGRASTPASPAEPASPPAPAPASPPAPAPAPASPPASPPQ
ncbi:hypothetical protein [Flaviflagellibacter deserti]|uniref:Uncharacterized protein n=1 Tax=Flaviflagellibacter deserti TaxID=2267266 RepID=A0ABV9YZD0_9HYPH